ncbi:MAG: hypothetical protein PVI57_17485 [Gemmatimonadota bacterium]|jgi:hypothetical protein
MAHAKWSTALTLAALLLVSACSPEADTDGAMEGDTMEEPAEEMGAGEMSGSEMMEPVSVTLDSKNESSVTGEATATHHADSVTVAVTISGASADGSFPAHVHSGDCVATGAVLAPLTSLEVTGGTGTSTTELEASQVPADQGAVIQVHDPTGQPVACGDLMGHGDTGEMN